MFIPADPAAHIRGSVVLARELARSATTSPSRRCT
jgi:hypothetical protein